MNGDSVRKRPLILPAIEDYVQSCPQASNSRTV